MSQAENNEQIDADILRARDIISLHKQKTHQKPQPQKTGEDATESADTAQIPAQKAETPREKTEIPRFDLAEEIMAEQRKITAIKRKAPGRKTEAERSEPQAGAAGHTIGQPTPGQSEQDRIIAEIVARDIERLCRGDTSDAKR
jgi:hypothetical protein